MPGLCIKILRRERRHAGVIIVTKHWITSEQVSGGIDSVAEW